MEGDDLWAFKKRKRFRFLARRQLSGLHFKSDEQEDKAAFEIQTQV